MCLQCPIIQPPQDDHPASSVQIPRQLLACLIDTLGPREVISKCDNYIRQKAIIWKDRDVTLRKLDEEKLAIKAELDRELDRLKETYRESLDDISTRRNYSFWRSAGLTVKADEDWQCTMTMLKSLPDPWPEDFQQLERERVGIVFQQALQSLDDEYVAMLEARACEPDKDKESKALVLWRSDLEDKLEYYTEGTEDEIEPLVAKD